MRIIKIFLFILITILTCACGIQLGGTWPTTTTQQGELEPTLDFQWYNDACGSTNTKWYILNPSKKEWIVEVSESNPSGGPRILKSYHSPPNTGTFNTATYIGIEQVGPNCFDRDFYAERKWPSAYLNAKEWAVAKAQYAVQRRLSVRSAFSDSYQKPRNLVTFDRSPLDCENECKSGSINCLRNTPPTDQVTRINQHLSALPNTVSTIDNSALLNILQQATNSCSRSDLVLLKKRVYNAGENCALTLRTSEAQAQPSAALLLSGGVKVDYLAVPAMSTFRLDFTKQADKPILAFTHQGLDADWGGEVLDITSTKDGVYYRTVAGCISAERKP